VAWTTPPTYTVSQILTAANLNSFIRDNGNFLHSPPGCQATRTTTQSIGSALNVAASFTGTDIYDTDTMHDPVGAPTVITFNTAGVYNVVLAVEFAANATGLRRYGINASIAAAPNIQMNANIQDTGPTAGVPSAGNVTLQVKAAAADTCIALVFQTSGGALNLLGTNAAGAQGNNASCQFGAQWISDGT